MSREGTFAPPWKIAPRLLLTRFFPARSLALLKGAWPTERKRTYAAGSKGFSHMGFAVRLGDF